MERQPITSSNIKSVGYDQDSATLEVEFSNGGIYQFKEMPCEAALEFIHEPVHGSHGKHMASKIKGKYESVKIS